MMASIGEKRDPTETTPITQCESWVHGTMTPEMKCICCLLDNNRYNKYAVTVQQIDNAKRDMLWLPDKTGTRQERVDGPLKWIAANNDSHLLTTLRSPTRHFKTLVSLRTTL